MATIVGRTVLRQASGRLLNSVLGNACVRCRAFGLASPSQKKVLRPELATLEKLHGRNYAKTAGSGPQVNREELETMIQTKKNPVLIDVREPEEVMKGKLPKSYNIPIGKVKTAFEMDDAVFKHEFGFPKPSKSEKNLIFYGLSMWGEGIKAKAAMDIARRLGYENARFYKGGFTEWSRFHK